MTVLDSIRNEYVRYRTVAERVFDQLDPHELERQPLGGGNSIATLAWHISGNLKSRFTDFLTTDGEKPWRRREDEFLPRGGEKGDLLRQWNEGWEVLGDALAELDDTHLDASVRIGGRELTVSEALQRSLTHVSYHVGQMVSFGRMIKGQDWSFITTPPGG